jgi:hypothetical protein
MRAQSESMMTDDVNRGMSQFGGQRMRQNPPLTMRRPPAPEDNRPAYEEYVSPPTARAASQNYRFYAVAEGRRLGISLTRGKTPINTCGNFPTPLLKGSCLGMPPSVGCMASPLFPRALRTKTMSLIGRKWSRSMPGSRRMPPATFRPTVFNVAPVLGDRGILCFHNLQRMAQQQTVLRMTNSKREDQKHQGHWHSQQRTYFMLGRHRTLAVMRHLFPAEMGHRLGYCMPLRLIWGQARDKEYPAV